MFLNNNMQFLNQGSKLLILKKYIGNEISNNNKNTGLYSSS